MPNAAGFGRGEEISANEGRGVAVDDVGIDRRIEAKRGLDSDAAGTRLAEKVGCEFGVDTGDFDGYFEPVWRRRFTHEDTKSRRNNWELPTSEPRVFVSVGDGALRGPLSPSR